uniref:Uncharacterized protein n=1 Tax=Cannabis sativa TaxID=3483 RepID=A0A803QJK3_CANSA
MCGVCYHKSQVTKRRTHPRMGKKTRLDYLLRSGQKFIPTPTGRVKKVDVNSLGVPAVPRHIWENSDPVG